MECLSKSMPYMTAPGNHDVCPPAVTVDGFTDWCAGDGGWECGSEYLTRYRMPGSTFSLPASGFRPGSKEDCLATYNSAAAQYWHAYTYGPVRFVVVSTEHDFTPGSPQLQWLSSTLGAVDRKTRRAVAMNRFSWAASRGARRIIPRPTHGANARGTTGWTTHHFLTQTPRLPR